MSDKNKCETCKWWDDREDGAPTANCCVFPQRIKTNGQYFCGQWREKNPPHLLETLPGYVEWSRDLHGYDILLECQRGFTAVSRGNKWFIPFPLVPEMKGQDPHDEGARLRDKYGMGQPPVHAFCQQSDGSNQGLAQ